MRTLEGSHVRFGEGYQPEKWCSGCREWFPITPEFWERKLWRCRACESDRSSLYQALRAHDPDWRAMQANKSRRYRKFVREARPELLETWDRLIEDRNAEKARKLRRGRAGHGDNLIGVRALTDEQVAAIRVAKRRGVSAADLASYYRVSVKSIYRYLESDAA